MNVTPDSFSDGGLYLDPVNAVEHGAKLAAEGAEILDVGGESTRPGSSEVLFEEELRRVLPVVEALHERLSGVQISIDTSKAAVAAAALDAGASFVNDVTSLRGDPEMAATIAAARAECALMHAPARRGALMHAPARRASRCEPTPRDDLVDEVKEFLQERMEFAVGAGIPEHLLLLDPGIGFGKTVAENLELLRRLDEIVALGRPVIVGTSRKSFLGKLAAAAAGASEPTAASRRLPGTIASNVLAFERGASVLRVHDVAAVRDALCVAAATLGHEWKSTNATVARKG